MDQNKFEETDTDRLTTIPLYKSKIQQYTLNQLAYFIRADWKKVFFGAEPYIRAMGQLTSINDRFGMDTGKDIVLRFLVNATTWRGEAARFIKAELNRRVKEAKHG